MLDLTHVLAGPYCTMILAELGAQVIKVEIPGDGDDSRAFGPFSGTESLYYQSINHDKFSIALNLKLAGDRLVFEELLGISDLIVENFRPGTMEKLGYGWDSLHARYPDLIYGAASGFGHSGPYSDRAAYDMVVQGMGGIMSITGYPDSPPTRVGISIGDITAGLYLTIGLLAALHKRNQGAGSIKVDIAMLDCQVAILENALVSYLTTGDIARPLGSRHREIAPFQAYSTKDGYIIIACGNDRLFAVLADALHRPDLLENPAYKTNDLRRENVDNLKTDLEKTLRIHSTREWITLLNTAGVPCGPINSIAEVAQNPQVLSRNMIVPINHPTIKNLKVAGNPIKMSGIPDAVVFKPAPAIDADREIILDLIAELKSTKGR